MNHLAFQPAFDVLHTEFRFLRIRRILTSNRHWRYDQIRIADFYLAFPFRLGDVRLKPIHRSVKRLAQEFSKGRYESQPDDHLLFSRMQPIHRAAAETLIANGFFDEKAFKSELIAETGKIEPPALSARIEQVNADHASLMEVIRTMLEDYPLLGANGLKDRTGLLEFRYDAI
ncbi:MAG TPA: ABC-three component system middle component 5 [Dokdonella sp.]|uniref:ABC-three component system middle component 5 n=1 Tax=Dokdonella sp. TaxID=2291710 RepID=UPI002B9A5BC7|nr:ABC-three component system middle component 5 [Dokdonella sp.]HUD40750.1 ABC-three component system middle component 5 [Dokdonella sp.]